MKTETFLGKSNIHVNDGNRSNKSSKQYSYKRKHKKQQKCNIRHGKRDFPKTTEMSVLTAPRCDVEYQSCKVDVRNELCNIRLMSFDNINVVTSIPQI